MRTRSFRTTSFVLGLLVAVVLIPVGVNAAGDAVEIKDADSAMKAQVEPGGKLKVGDGAGALTVNGSVDTLPAAPRAPFHETSTLLGGDAIPLNDTVPAGRTLAITSILVANTSDSTDVDIIVSAYRTDPGGVSCFDGTEQQLAHITARTNETVHLSYPQPLIVEAHAGTTCVTWEAAASEASPTHPVHLVIDGYHFRP